MARLAVDLLKSKTKRSEFDTKLTQYITNARGGCLPRSS